MVRRVRKGLAVALGGAAAAWGLARWAGAFRFAVEGDSMAPALLPGQFLVATRSERIRRGDVVVVRLPSRGIEVVKRVVGLPGERITIAGGRVEVNGHPLREPYASGTGAAGDWDLGPDEHFILGDNRDRSTDSRDFGPVPSRAVAGVARFRYWPRVERVR